MRLLSEFIDTDGAHGLDKGLSNALDGFLQVFYPEVKSVECSFVLPTTKQKNTTKKCTYINHIFMRKMDGWLGIAAPGGGGGVGFDGIWRQDKG